MAGICSNTFRQRHTAPIEEPMIMTAAAIPNVAISVTKSAGGVRAEETTNNLPATTHHAQPQGRRSGHSEQEIVGPDPIPSHTHGQHVQVI